LVTEADRALRDANDPATAARLCARAIELQHDAVAAHTGLAAACAAQGRTEDALDSYHLALHFDPGNVGAQLGCGFMLLALDRHAEAIPILRRLVAQAPDHADARYALGRALKASGDGAGALVELRAAAQLEPASAEYENLTGFVAWQLGHYDEARVRLARAVALAPQYAEARHNLGLVTLEAGEPALALGHFRAALATSPRPAATLSGIGHALRDLGRLDEAIAEYAAALVVQADLGDARINRCYARLMQDDYAGGWDDYECRFEASGTGPGGTGAPRWQGDPLAGRRLLIYGEQGVGDEIMFASCLPEALARAGAGVTIACDPRLAGLFRRSFPGAAVIGAARGAQAAPPDFPAVDCEIPIGSLPGLFRRTASAFSSARGFLRADPARVAYWRTRLATERPGPWLALAWRGGSLRTRARQRSIPLGECLPLFALGAAVVNLQYGDTLDEAAELRERHGVALHDFPEARRDLDETAALLAATDFAVTIDNTIAHLAGGLARPGCVLLSAYPEWRYPRAGARWPWYPTLRLARQAAPGNWKAAIAEACVAFGRQSRGGDAGDASRAGSEWL
jgi:tetratricopeptide (TPR) repeat protein